MNGVVPVILAGGSGHRLWPLSRQAHPTPFVTLPSGMSLLDAALERARWVADAPPVVVCHEEHRFLAAERMRRHGHRTGRVVLEPAARGTAPAMAIAARLVLAEYGDAPILFLPADHTADGAEPFRAAVAAGLDAAAAEPWPIVAFGIVPTFVRTGYGWIEKSDAEERSAHPVRAFVEKADADTARGFLASGRHLWNSGMYLMCASTCLDEVAAHSRQTAGAAARAFEQATLEADFFRPGKAFLDSPAASFDTTVLAKGARHARVVAAAFEWRRIGTWADVHDAASKDAAGNTLVGDVIPVDVSDSLIDARTRLVVALGLERTLVAETADAVLVAPLAGAGEARAIAAHLAGEGRPESRAHTRVWRSWGTYVILDRGDNYLVKRLSVDPGAAISVQKHRHRSEHWVVVRGIARVDRDGHRFLLRENESAFIPVGSIHTLHNPTDAVLEVVEVQVGDQISEEDIVRY